MNSLGKDDLDRETFLKIPGQCCARIGGQVHAFCLMPNHFHLVAEWIAGTNPTNTLSTLRMLDPLLTPTGVTLSWQSVSSISYFLERGTNLANASAFIRIQSNLPGQAGLTMWTDTNRPVVGPAFYHVGIEE
ncbi:MAG TPA: hypothetical protein P5186_27495 [Candidatus Paceibacterota bacterium]|nr:hypothetical protein [Verrucomicrobiota bacterium]HRY51799.1 hypothetical protein [Candidatus Paceibacterota bacterium]